MLPFGRWIGPESRYSESEGAVEKEKTILTPAVPSPPKAEETSADGTPSSIPNASKEEFEKVKHKVFTLHDGLFRRLAEHDRQR